MDPDLKRPIHRLRLWQENDHPPDDPNAYFAKRYDRVMFQLACASADAGQDAGDDMQAVREAVLRPIRTEEFRKDYSVERRRRKIDEHLLKLGVTPPPAG